MKILITGGLGFIGVNTALELFKDGNEIFIIDNLSRKGNIENLTFLKEHIDFKIWNRDIRNYFDVADIFRNNNFDVVVHLAAQVAVTSSVRNPREDFEINALGTFNILECVREFSPKSIVIYSSTNKVYGNFKSNIDERQLRYVYGDGFIGINEEQNLDFHSPYGCSKGTADQYMRDYNRIYGLKTVVLRQSCIYGPNQFGIEDQGWVSWFSIASMFDKKFTIYGDGKQVRDILHVYDLIDLYKTVIYNIDNCAGKIYNTGGGPSNTMSLLELIDLIEKKLNKSVEYDYSDWRPGDQKIYISDISKIESDTGWNPKIGVEDGVNMMIDWISNNKSIFKNLNLV
jgi:CDP-paratose 2-epimerase